MEGNNRYEFEEAYKHSLLNLNLYFIFLRTKHNWNKFHSPCLRTTLQWNQLNVAPLQLLAIQPLVPPTISILCFPSAVTTSMFCIGLTDYFANIYQKLKLKKKKIYFAI